jgi:hypothetical protein
MDFNKGFLEKIKLACENYSQSQKLDHEKLYFCCRVCFKTRHMKSHGSKGPRQDRKHRCKSTRWVGAKAEHHVIRKYESNDSDLPKDETKIESK